MPLGYIQYQDLGFNEHKNNSDHNVTTTVWNFLPRDFLPPTSPKGAHHTGEPRVDMRPQREGSHIGMEGTKAKSVSCGIYLLKNTHLKLNKPNK